MVEDPRPRRTAERVLFAVVAPLQRFLRSQAAGGIVLIVMLALALAWANSPWAASYQNVLHVTVDLRAAGRGLSWSLHAWVNEALMTVFFLLAGMEIKRESVVGELRTVRRAMLPLVAAAGGMATPALLYAAFNAGGPGRAGWGIPMATDIAFALGCMSLLRRRIPNSLFVFLMALAIFDDLGAMLVIAFFYGGELSWAPLAVAGALTLGLVALARARVQRVWPYLVLGLALWVAFLHAGVHPTLAGVVLGLSLPVEGRKVPSAALDDLDAALDALRRMDRHRGSTLDADALAALEEHIESVQSPLDRLTRALRDPVAFGILPLFALVNAGVDLRALTLGRDELRVTIGVLVGLAAGKTAGVFGATFVAVRLGLAPRPSHSSWPQLLGVSIMAGIGFTMSLFIAGLAFVDDPLNDAARMGVLGASLVCALAGIALLRAVGRPVIASEEPQLAPVVVLPRFARGYRVEPWEVEGPLAGESLEQADLRRSHGITVIGVWRDGRDRQRHLEPVDASYRLTPGDVLLIVGKDSAIEAFLAHARPMADTPAEPRRGSPASHGTDASWG